MKNIILLLLAVPAVTGCNSSQQKNGVHENSMNIITTKVNEWTPLFDANTTEGWHSYGKNIAGNAWQMKNGTLHLDATKKNDWQTLNGGDLVTNKEYENFDLVTEWKISRAGNSGIMFYVHEDTTIYKYPWQTGPETQIADNQENEDGKLIKHRAGDLYDLLSIAKDVVKPAGEWNKTEVIANNGKLDILVNDEKVLSTKLWDAEWKKRIADSKFKEWPGFGTYKKGRIALQDHGADVWFRNLKIRKL